MDHRIQFHLPIIDHPNLYPTGYRIEGLVCQKIFSKAHDRYYTWFEKADPPLHMVAGKIESLNIIHNISINGVQINVDTS